MEISDEVYINSMNDISKHFQIMLDNKDKKIADLQSQLDQANERLKGAIVPKFKKDDYVYALFTQTEIYKCQIDAFDYYTNSYLVFPNEDVGNEWINADKVFKSKAEAQAKLQELRGGDFSGE